MGRGLEGTLEWMLRDKGFGKDLGITWDSSGLFFHHIPSGYRIYFERYAEYDFGKSAWVAKFSSLEKSLDSVLGKYGVIKDMSVPELVNSLHVFSANDRKLAEWRIRHED